MMQPDKRLFQPVMTLRGAVLAIMLVTYTVLWLVWRLPPESDETRQFIRQFGIMAGILGAEALLSFILFVALSPKNTALLVHLSLLIDTVATTGLIHCTGYAGSVLPLFYLLILLAAGLLYGLGTGIYYFLCISLANVAAVVVDQVDPLFRNAHRQPGALYFFMGAALPLVAFPLLLVFRLTQRGRYLEALYENISDGLLILDDIGRIVEVNGRVVEMTGLERHELVAMPLESLVAVGEGGAVRIQPQLQLCLAGESVSFELLLARKGAEPLAVERN